MNKENENTKIKERDLLFIEKEFSQTEKPLSLCELTRKLVYQKTSSQLSQKVKKYDPYCKYEIGDFIYKEYDEPLMVSSKGVELFKGGAVFKVVNKIEYKNFNCEMLEVDYSGGGPFRKHIDYMKKTKTQVLLPSNLERKARTPETMKKEEDPRLDELPMIDRDIKKLEMNLKSALLKSPQFFNWNDYWQLKEKKMKIKEEIIKEIEKHLLETKHSAETSELVAQYFGLKPNQDQFPLFCLSLNDILEKKYKKNFIYVSSHNWGKWHMKQTLNSLLENSPLSAPKAKLPRFEQEKKITSVREYPLKIYLTWREILSGGLKIPKSYNKELSKSREYVFTDVEGKKDYTVYYYPSSNFFLGLKDFYESNNVPQGASLTLEKNNSSHFSFWLKKSKKKLSVAKIIYSPDEDKFTDFGEDAFTFSLPNKIIHLQRETLKKLFSFYNQREDLDLRELLILIFKNFGLGGDKSSLHYLRAYHLVDILRQTTEEDVETTLLNSTGFIKSEKKKGIFLYQEKMGIEEEKEAEALPEIPPEARPEEKVEEVPPEAPVEEIVPSGLEEVRVKAPAEAQKIEIREPAEVEKPLPPMREKEFKKKRPKIKVEREKVLRRRKGEKRFIEERIELEESEQEALIAIKAKEKKEAEEERLEARPKEKKEEYKPFVSEEPIFGVFAEKLKTALDKKKKGKKKK